MEQFFVDFYNDNRDWFSFTGKLFLFAMVVGGISFVVKPDLIAQIVGIFQTKFGTEPARDWQLVREIFTQNLFASMIAMIGGVVLGISSFIVIFFNGFIIGFVILSLLFVPGNVLHNLLVLVAGLVPHGIFEIPAFLLAATIGLRLGTEWLHRDTILPRATVFKGNLKRMLYSIPIVVILLAIAAILEVFVSGYFVNKL